MRLLVRRPGISVGDVAQELGLQPSNVSGAVRALVARGLLERRRHDADGRVARLVPTRRAIAARDRREAAWGAALAVRLAELPDAEAARLLRAAKPLRTLAENLATRA